MTEPSPFPWKPCPEVESFVVDANGVDVCLLLSSKKQPVKANRRFILASGPLASALQALGIHPFEMEDGTPAHGYCFCPQPSPGALEPEHTGQCREARAALEDAGVPLVTVSPEEAA